MFSTRKPLDFEYLRRQTVGMDETIATPFGKRLMVYGDYTASGRCLGFIEDIMRHHQAIYANTHTEDDETGRTTSLLLQEAEQIIKKSVNAQDHNCIVTCGAGATACIYRLQQILGIALPTTTWTHIDDQLKESLSEEGVSAFRDRLERTRPVVFVGPYEHHSNEISWRAGLATVVEVDLDEDGGISLDHLAKLLQEPQYEDRLRVGSFSAASNVTGMRSPVHEIAKILHHHDALACFDYSASAPYEAIDMNPADDGSGENASLDAIFLSPHKFIGGPGSSGVLIFDEKIYARDMAPSIAGGGTVAYVNQVEQDFFSDIEEREKAGTPGILQTLKAALAFAVKDSIAVDEIEARERELLLRAFDVWGKNPAIEILGNPDPARRIAIVSFNVLSPDGRYLHPKFVTVLLNDLFGVQSRAGCACAGPYGHRLLGIDLEMSQKYRDAINSGIAGVKPGWCRVNLHFTMDDAEAQYLIDAVNFVASHGHLFLELYEFDLVSGLWSHRNALPIQADLLSAGKKRRRFMPLVMRKYLYRSYLRAARGWAERLGANPPQEEQVLPENLKDLQFFALPPRAT
ncbi:MAG: aminotransferase class V-fold PLP-dependent enzyme [Proteobacteria bacterium]|nr:aminotransferase class V-fold PLP-dependent enzyme [Pseudomonadota bacterium]